MPKFACIGRPSGPEFYISTEDNTYNHGPASQGSKTEADACFGKLYDQDSIDIATWMLKQVMFYVVCNKCI